MIYSLGMFLLLALIRTTKIRLSSSEVLFFQQVRALEMMTLVKLMCCWVTFKKAERTVRGRNAISHQWP